MLVWQKQNCFHKKWCAHIEIVFNSYWRKSSFFCFSVYKKNKLFNYGYLLYEIWLGNCVFLLVCVFELDLNWRGGDFKPFFIPCVLQDTIFKILNKFYDYQEKTFLSQIHIFPIQEPYKNDVTKKQLFLNLLPPFHSLSLIFQTLSHLVTNQKVKSISR